MYKDDTINILAEPVKELVCPECNFAIDVTGENILSSIECPECGAELTVPARLGDFILVEVLGAGGMATVYKAYDESLGRYVAVKIMRRQYGNDPKFVERFLREARAAARINHPNVVQIYSCGQKNGQPYIVMEYVDGGKFDLMIANDAPLDEGQVLDVGRDVADGLRAASDIGLVHGDIKPANIVFDRNGMAKVADFGLAHFATEEEDRSEVWGTPYYIAPERARKEGQDHRSDIYCLGATLFHAITGEPPFDGETAVDVVMARLENDAPNLLEVRDDISTMTAKLIGRMMERDLVKRYPNYNSLLSDFDKAIEELTEFKRTQRQKNSAKKSSNRKKKSSGKKESAAGCRKVVWITLIAALLVAGAVGAFLFWPDKREEPEETQTPNIETKQTDKPVQLQPFSIGQDSSLFGILKKLRPETALATKGELQGLKRTLSKKNAAREWIKLFHATVAAMQRNAEERNKYLESIPSSEADYGAQQPATDLPVRIARFMQGEIDTPAPPEDKDWPQWYLDLTLFFDGFANLLEGNFDESSKELESYIAKETPAEEPTWPYGLQALAKNLNLRTGKWKNLEVKLDSLVASEKYEDAINILDKVRSDLFLPFKRQKLDAINARKSAAEAAVRQKTEAQEKARKEREEAKKREAEQRRKQAVQADLEKVQEWNKTVRPLLLKNEFKTAIRARRMLRGQLKTDKGDALFEERITEIQRLFDLKNFLVDSINRIPYQNATRILKGNAVASSLDSITVELAGGIGTTEYAWSRVDPNLLIPLARFYLGRSGLDKEGKAKVMLGLAEYSKLHSLGMEDNFMKAAEKLDPDLGK